MPGDLAVSDLEKDLTSLHIPDGVGLSDWLSLTKSCSDLREACTWFLVDLISYGFVSFGEDFWQIEGTVAGLSEYSVARYLKIGASFPPDRRREGLSVSHHEAVRSLDLEDQERLLDDALETGMNRDELRELCRQARQRAPQRARGELQWNAQGDRPLSPERAAWRSLVRSAKPNGAMVNVDRVAFDQLGTTLFGENYSWQSELEKESD